MQVSGGIQWVMVVNLVIWTGLFLYLRRLDSKVQQLTALADSPESAPARRAQPQPPVQQSVAATAAIPGPPGSPGGAAASGEETSR